MSLGEVFSLNSFVSIDSSTTSLAFAYVEDGKIKRYGKVVFSGHGIYERIADISRKTEGLFKFFPSKSIVIESGFFSNNPKTSTNLALAQGSILGAASVMGVADIYAVPPVSWQSGIKNGTWNRDQKLELQNQFPGKSAAWYKNKMRQLRKQKTIDTVNEQFGLSVTDDDVADALGIALFSINNKSKILGYKN